MKLHTLEIEGFGPFRERQSITFDDFDDEGIFLIAGRTGAGKSSILDGVGFALFGGVPRYDGGAKRLRSDHCRPGDVTEVRLEFSVGETRWRVTRSPEYERPKRSGTGMTTEAHRAVVEELVEGSWVGRAAKPREAADVLGRVIGLNREQFQQVILLAQNRFAQFLLADNDDRQSLLRTLFGTRAYEEYERELERRRKEAEAVVGSRRQEVDLLLEEAERHVAQLRDADSARGEDGDDRADISAHGDDAPHDDGARDDGARDIGARDIDARLDAVDDAVRRADECVAERRQTRDRALAVRARADEEHRTLRAQHDGAEERDRVRHRRDELADAEGEIAEIRAERDRAAAAELLRASLEAASRAAEASAAAAQHERDARADWRRIGGGAHITAAQAGEAVDTAAGELALARAAAERERAIPGLRTQCDELDARSGAGDAEAADISRRLAELPAVRAELEQERHTHAERAATAADATRRLDEIGERLDAAVRTRELQRRLDEATQRVRDADAAGQEAIGAVQQLFTRRLAEYAGELAADLSEGTPCPVCGSTEHPTPAGMATEPVTDDDIARAERDRDAALERTRAATDARDRLRSEHAAAYAAAGGSDIAALEEQREVERERLRTAEAAAHAVRAGEERLAALEREREELTAQDLRVRGELEQLAQTRAAARERLHAAQEDARTARGDFESVAERLTATEHRHTVATRLRDAIAAAGVAAEAAGRADADLTERLRASDFNDADSARAALRDAQIRARWDRRISEHDTDVTVTRRRLDTLDAQLADAPDPLPDLGESARALAEAGEHADVALSALTDAEHLARALADVGVRARRAHDAVAEHERTRVLVAGLADAAAGRNDRKMDLETFVLAAELEHIVVAANVRLEQMSSGRYRLEHTDALAARRAASGLGLEIVDAYTGQARPAQSLSGGETFLASLALALGLAQVVTDRAGGIRLDTLFIDEGFGSLDPETLEMAMRTLDELRQGGRTVGVISHVEAMKEQLPAQLLVEAAAQGPSRVRAVGV